MSDTPAVLSMWTVYDHPADYPESFVVREFHIGRGETTPTDTVAAFPTLAEVRAYVQQVLPGATCITRSPDDDPVIVETWL